MKIVKSVLALAVKLGTLSERNLLYTFSVQSFISIITLQKKIPEFSIKKFQNFLLSFIKLIFSSFFNKILKTTASVNQMLNQLSFEV